MSANGHPDESAFLLQSFGGLAGRIAALTKAEPLLVTRLLLAPTRAAHAIAAYLYLAPDAAQCDAVVAQHLFDTHPRLLLADAYPGAQRRLYRALDRVEGRIGTKEFYQRLGVVLAGPFSIELLAGGEINTRRLRHYESLAAADPLTIALIGCFGAPQFSTVTVLDGLVVTLRALGALDGVVPSLDAKAGPQAALRLLQRAVDSLAAPAADFDVPTGWRQLLTVRELRQVGAEYDNCTRSARRHGARHWFDLVSGTMVFLAADEARVLVALRRVAPNRVYVVEEAAGPKNQPLTAKAEAEMRGALRNANVSLVEGQPADLLWRTTILAGDQHGDPGDAAGEIRLDELADDFVGFLAARAA